MVLRLPVHAGKFWLSLLMAVAVLLAQALALPLPVQAGAQHPPSVDEPARTTPSPRAVGSRAATGDTTPPTAAATARPITAPEQLTVQVLSAYPHDPEAFTQGLLFHDGALYESTGLYGRSSLRQVNLTTGAMVRQIDLPTTFFGEGLARVDDRLIQLTWRHRVAPVYDLASFETVGEFSYAGDGWGLCFDGKQLIMSDGSHRLYFRDPTTFAIRRQLAVTLEGEALPRLNELECVGEAVYANVWPTSRIVKISKRNGVVRATIDAAALLSNAEQAALGEGATLNGIAHDAASETFLLTGKLWPKLFRVRFVRR